MENLIIQDKLEDLLIAKWACFVDVRRLMAFVMSHVRDAQLPHVADDEVAPKGVQITISRFQWKQEGFLVWVDFTIPVERTQIAVGTTELLLKQNGEVVHHKTIGNVFTQKT